MFLPRGRLLLVLLLTLAASPAQSEPPSEKKPPVHLDRYGDPLPEGAIARMGTVRFRHEGKIIKAVAFSHDGRTQGEHCHRNPSSGDNALHRRSASLRRGKQS